MAKGGEVEMAPLLRSSSLLCASDTPHPTARNWPHSLDVHSENGAASLSLTFTKLGVLQPVYYKKGSLGADDLDLNTSSILSLTWYEL
jgi:hypothetical protein